MGDPVTAPGRRDVLRGVLAALGGLGVSAAGLSAAGVLVEDAHALGRVPIGGVLTLRVPWATARLDPHDLFDPLAGLFGSAVADPVYALDNKGRPYPTLADGMPKVVDGETVVTLRPGLRSARGRALTGRDLAWSCTRARRSGAAGLLAAAGPYVRSDRAQPLMARFGRINPGKLAVLLSSPLLALLPVGFKPTQPDGSGSFLAKCKARSLVLTRNLNASRGPAFLQKVVIKRGADLSDSLRAFETGSDDVGWLGMGFHRDRPGARKFAFGSAGWVVLACGTKAGRFHVPGAAQQLANSIPSERLHLGLSARKGLRPGSAWTGDPAELIYDVGQPHLRAIADTVAAKLSQPGHEVTARGISRDALRRLRKSQAFALALDVVRHPGAGLTGPLIALATADRRARGVEVGRRPPRTNYSQPGHRLTTTLRLGVLGGLAVRGGVRGGVTLAAESGGRGIRLGGSYRS